MKKTYLIMLFVMVISFSCRKDKTPDPYPNKSFEVVFDGIPFNTETNMRIGYTLKTFEFEKDGLKLQKVTVINNATEEEVFTLKVEDIGRFYRDPIPPSTLIDWDQLDSYYFSIQVPIPLGTEIPDVLSHKFTFNDTINNTEVILTGADYFPRKDVQPIVISSPTKGNRQIFFNQSTQGYHFDVLMFFEGGVFYPERFAIDEMKLNETYTDTYVGDPTDNESYECYGDTLYAVADAIVNFIQDGHVENNGNLMDAPLNSLDDFGGNMVMLDIGNNLYAVYAHCIPGSIMVNVNDVVKEGQPIALLGNSGNSSEPHLHFHIAEGEEFWKSKGVPFVLKTYTKTGDFESGLIVPEVHTNSLMEQLTLFKID